MCCNYHYAILILNPPHPEKVSGYASSVACNFNRMGSSMLAFLLFTKFIVLLVQDLKTSYFTDVHKTSVNVVSQSQQQTATEISETLIKIWIKEALDLYR